MLALLSPSKTLNMDEKKPLGEATPPTFIEHTKQLSAILKDYSESDIKSLMKLSDNLAELNHARYQGFETPFTPKNAKQAIFAFKGDVYDGLDVDTLSDAEIKRSNNSIRILSGLYGLLKPLDLMQAYRLEMGTKLENKQGKNLYEFWGNAITEQLNTEIAEHKDSLIINLASNEYFKAVKPKNLKGELITIDFKEKKDNEYKTIGIYAKKARGLMARYIVQKNVTSIEDLKKFNAQGYCYNDGLSLSKTLVFTRNQ